MEKSMQDAAMLGAENATRINFNKLQAVLCIASSAAVSIGVIYWLVTLLR